MTKPELFRLAYAEARAIGRCHRKHTKRQHAHLLCALLKETLIRKP